MMDDTERAFIETTKRRRSDAGKPEKITVPTVYSLLDGLLAHRNEEGPDAAA